MAPSKRRFALSVTLWGIFGANITLTILTIALPYIARDLHADRALTNWVTLGPMLVVAVMTPAAGRMADNLGRKRIWIVGSLLSIVGMLASAVSPSLTELLAARVVTGAGAALMMPSALAIATGLYPPEERATPIGYWTSTIAISPMLGVVLGGELLEHVSWRYLFAGQAALAVPPVIAAWVGFDETRYPVAGRFDWEGSTAVGLASLSLMMAATFLGAGGTGDPRVLLALGLALVACVWAVSAERRAQNPVLPPSLMRDPIVRMSVVARLTLNFSYMGAFMTLPYLLAEIWQLSSGTASWLLLFRPLAMGVTGPFTGRLSARFGKTSLVLVGALAIALSTLAFLLLGETPSRGLLIAGLAIAGVGLGLASPAIVAIVTARVGHELLGTASGMMTLTATLANALGMAALFAVVETSGGVKVLAAYRASFWAGTFVLVIGVAAALRLRALAAPRPG